VLYRQHAQRSIFERCAQAPERLELRCHLIDRRFTPFDAESSPVASCFGRLFAVLSPEVTKRK
jgi:hypothetical protein